MVKGIKDIFKGHTAGAFGSVSFIVAGLGNPGREYETTRHNAGFMAVDYIKKREGFEMKRLKFRSLCEDCMISGRRVLFLKPSTFMNKSGEAVRDAMQFYNIPPERTLIIFDDVSLEVGNMRIRRKGSDGGQKGMQNIIYLTGSDDFPRIRIGIGKKAHPDMALADWVLSRFTTQDIKSLESVNENVYEAVKLIVSGDIDGAMNRYNTILP